MKLKGSIACMALLLSSCLKEELPVPARPPGDARTLQACMGSGYEQQHWIDLGTGNVVASGVKTDWDLAFESAPEGWRIMLNGARLMMAWNMGPGDLTQAIDTTGLFEGRRIDAPSGHPDSTAIGDLRGSEDIVLLDLGYDALGSHQGFAKLMLQAVDGSTFSIRTARLDGGDLRTWTIAKDPQRTWTHFSLSAGVRPIGPPRGQWDLQLTQYTYIFRDIDLPYLVVGALIDGTTTRVARITGKAPEDVVLADTLDHPFERRRDIIGYDWKTYSFDTNAYTVASGLTFIVQDAEGYFHKLRFVDYYDQMGRPGCPQFEVTPL